MRTSAVIITYYVCTSIHLSLYRLYRHIYTHIYMYIPK